MKKLRIFIIGFTIVFGACNGMDDFEEQELDQEVGATDFEEGIAVKASDLPPNVVVAGRVENGFNASLVLEANTSNGVLRIAQDFTDGEGNFVLHGAIADMGLYQLRLEEKLSQGQEPKVIPLTLEVDDSVFIRLNFDGFSVNPVYENTRWAPVLTGYMEELKKFIDWQKTIVNPQSYDRNELMEMVIKEKKGSDDFAIKQIQKDPANPANIVLMSNLFPNMGFEYWDEKQLKALQKMHRAFEEEFPDHPMTVNVGAQIAELETSYNEFNAFTKQSMAPDIVMKDPLGKIRRLSDLKGKYVLIDFWASWCGPCRVENPNVVRMYNEYKDKNFAIFSVSLDTDMQRWKKAIESDNLIWDNHVSDLQGWQSSVVSQYQFQGIPHTVLVDPSGKIIATNLRGAALERKLKEVLPK
jgi:thiol-disulfide isomerase/thioredoxin